MFFLDIRIFAPVRLPVRAGPPARTGVCGRAFGLPCEGCRPLVRAGLLASDDGYLLGACLLSGLFLCIMFIKF
tara:strand:+ start:668 stop:886 length:219 start_codon:yes stop_codon:yes gene_type:complete